MAVTRRGARVRLPDGGMGTVVRTEFGDVLVFLDDLNAPEPLVWFRESGLEELYPDDPESW